MWYATRASGYTALLLLSASVVLGMLTSLRESRRDWPRFVVQSLHRNVVTAGRRVPCYSHPHLGHRPVREAQFPGRVRAVHRHVPPPVARPRRRGVRAADRDHGDEPDATSPRVANVAGRAPLRIRELAGRRDPRPRDWNGHQVALGAPRRGGVRGRGCRRARLAPCACRAGFTALRVVGIAASVAAIVAAGGVDGCGATAARAGPRPPARPPTSWRAPGPRRPHRRRRSRLSPPG